MIKIYTKLKNNLIFFAFSIHFFELDLSVLYYTYFL